MFLAGQWFLCNSSQLINFMTSGPIVAFELMGTGAVSKWREMMGPTDSAEARKQAPAGLRARFGKDTTENACHGSDSLSSAAREIEFFFPSTGPVRENTAKMSECTCCVIKPHSVLAGKCLMGNLLLYICVPLDASEMTRI